MAEDEQLDAQELAMLVKRLDRQRRARVAADSISEQATGVLYDKQQHLKLLQAVAVAANESPSLDDALQATVDQLCTHLGWPVGHAYLAIGTTSILTLSDIWFIGDLNRFEQFRRVVETTLVAPAGGVAGRALVHREPVLASELDGFLALPLAAAAREAGLKSAFAFPVIAPEGPVAVLEFFSTDIAEPDPMLLDVITRIGDLLGQAHVRTRMSATLNTSEEQYRLLFEGNAQPMWIHDTDSLEIIAANAAVSSHYGYDAEEILRLSVAALIEGALPARRLEGRLPIRTKAGAVVEAELTGYDLKLPGRRARMVMAADINAARQAEDALRESERRFREMLDTIDLVAVLLDVVGIVTYCNPFLLKITGYSKDEVIGRNFFEMFLAEERREAASRQFASNIGQGVIAAHSEFEILARDGSRRMILWNYTVLRNSQASILGTAGIGTDVTEQRLVESQLVHNAFHDSLTALPNRSLFLDRVGHALARRKQAFAVLVLDVDHFKNVNDSLGHAAGDQLLVQIGERLCKCVRAADTVSRFGGDEFTVLVENVSGPADALRAAERIVAGFTEPFRVEGNEIYTSATVGISLGGPEYESAEQVLRDADTAMYRAKAQGRARFEMFDADMRSEVVARLKLETDLRRAVENGELFLMYQPIVELDTGRIVGREALARWQHPERGLISPAEFIPVAEESNIIVAIGRFALFEACRSLSKIGPGEYMAVNVSTRHFVQADLVADVRAALNRCGMPPESLYLEITESVLIQQPEAALAIISELRAMGCRVSLDDFGTGYSSLAYLHRFPIDTLKIDGSFLRAVHEAPKNVEILRAMVSLGLGLGISVVAEGIETEQQRDLLISLGCTLGQGYLFARPGKL